MPRRCSITEPAREGGKNRHLAQGCRPFRRAYRGPSRAFGLKTRGGPANAIHEAARQILRDRGDDRLRSAVSPPQWGLINGGTGDETPCRRHCRFSIDLRVATVS